MSLAWALAATIGGVAVERARDLGAEVLRWTAGLAIDADGSPHAYALDGKGLDRLANAGKPGKWWGLVVDADGDPVVQGEGDPAPGFFVSPTSLCDRSKRLSDPRRYVDSETVAYIAVPPELVARGVAMGDVALVACGALTTAAIVADVGPHGHLGEGSIALARALGIDADPRLGGCEGGVQVTLWPGTHATPAWPRSKLDIAGVVRAMSRAPAVATL